MEKIIKHMDLTTVLSGILEILKIILNLFLGRSYIVEYYADSEYMKKLISDSENGREFIKELGTEFKEFNKVKEKL